MLAPERIMDRIRSMSERHDTIQVEFRIWRWRVSVNGHTVSRSWRRDDAVALGNFLARLASPSTLIVTPGPGQPLGERREFLK